MLREAVLVSFIVGAAVLLEFRMNNMQKHLEKLHKEETVSIRNKLLEAHHEEIASLRNELSVTHSEDLTSIRKELSAATMTSGSIFIVWGRKTCPNDNTIIYSGMTGGGNYKNPGSSVEPVCLPLDPVFGSRTAKTYSDYIHGSEYVSDDFYGPGTSDHDVPCVVCNSRGSQVLMIPGRNRCYNGWNEEYHGYLGSNYYINKRGSKLTCIHEIPEFLQGGSANKDGYVFNGVLVHCGSLKCPPYINNKPITCVVCSR